MYLLDHDPRWYRIAARAADEAMARAADARGLYLKAWDGTPVSTVRPGRLQTQAATTSLLAWVALAGEHRR